MGRGRAKAKQQKVARDLKYNTHFTDLDALQRELGAGNPADRGRVDDVDTSDDYDEWTGTDR